MSDIPKYRPLTAIAQDWEYRDFELHTKGDGGISLHITEEDRQKFVARKSTDRHHPWGAWYKGPGKWSLGKPHLAVVDEKIYSEILNTEDGRWYDKEPEGIRTGPRHRITGRRM